MSTAPSFAAGARSWSVRSGEDLGRALAEIRQERGLTQAQLAELTGIQRSYLAEIEAGQSVQMIERILRALRRLGADVTVTASARAEPDAE